MTLRSLAPCLRAAREKHRFAAGKNIGKEKNTFGSRKKRPCSGKKLSPQREKTPAKNAASQREKFKAAEKTPCSSKKHLCSRKNAFWRQREKTIRGGKNPSEARKKTAEAGKKHQQQRKPSFATQKVPATEKIHFRNGKKQQPPQN